MRACTTQPADEDATNLVLVVVGPEMFIARVLPAAGKLTIGRDSSASICLSDQLASRMHARLTVKRDGRIENEDLGSRNGTRVRGKPAPPRTPVEVITGDSISIGATTLLLQNRAASQPVRQEWGHAYFHGRVEEECRRHLKTPRSFAIVRLRVAPEFPRKRVLEIINRSIASSDVLASFGPNDLELLLFDRTPQQARHATTALVEALTSAGSSCRGGLACFPADGHNADALLSRTGDVLRDHAEVATDEEVVFADPVVLAALEQAKKAAGRNASVLIHDETGAGKEVFARTIHAHSPRAAKPFVPVDCACLNTNLFESELFGHERGAFTGASSEKPGLLEQAPGGTVFLDELGELPLSAQAKLLRVLETRLLTRLGAVKPKPIDVRFIAATNRDLSAEIAAKTFRGDLYHRLAVFEIRIPPLRDRRRDIAPLAQAFLRRFCREDHRPDVPRLSPRVLTLLEAHDWPGNVRELRNIMERALTFCSGDEILPEHLQLPTRAAEDSRAHVEDGTDPMRFDPADRIERQRMIEALESCVWNQTRAAKKLGMAQSTFSYKLDRYAIARPRKRTGPKPRT